MIENVLLPSLEGIVGPELITCERTKTVTRLIAQLLGNY